MPAVIIRDRGQGRIGDLRFPRQLGFRQVGHPDDVTAPAAIKIGFGFGGNSASLTAVDEKTAQIKLPSGVIRLVSNECYATIGQASNFESNSINLGKAGKSRWLNIRPAVRGSAMNPVDHPHGGGEGRQGIGLKHPKTPWGKPALGKKTRKKKKYSNKFIIKRRVKRK